MLFVQLFNWYNLQHYYSQYILDFYFWTHYPIFCINYPFYIEKIPKNSKIKLKEGNMDINLVTNLSKDYTNVKVTIEAPEMNDDIKMMVDIIESFSNSKKNLISYSDGKK